MRLNVKRALTGLTAAKIGMMGMRRMHVRHVVRHVGVPKCQCHGPATVQAAEPDLPKILLLLDAQRNPVACRQLIGAWPDAPDEDWTGGDGAEKLQAFRLLLAEGGVLRFYRGLLPEMVGNVPTRTAMYAGKDWAFPRLFSCQLLKLCPGT
eukprot:s228_g42.t1